MRTEAIILGRIGEGGFCYSKVNIYSASGVCPPILSSGWKDQIKVLIKGGQTE